MKTWPTQIGERRYRNIRNHRMIIYGIMNSIIRGDEECVDLQIYDLEKAFDSLWLEDSLNNIYGTVSEHSRNNKLALLLRNPSPALAFAFALAGQGVH